MINKRVEPAVADNFPDARRCFQNADRGCPDGDYSAAGFFDAIYQFRVFFIDAELFFVYLVFFERFRCHRLKCPLSDGKRDISELNPLVF